MTEKEYIISRIKDLEQSLGNNKASVKEKIRISRAIAVYQSDLERVLNSEQ